MRWKFGKSQALCTALSVLGLLLVFGRAALGWDIFPEVVGNKATDSVVLSFETFDTSYYPLLANADSLKILRFGPTGARIDSLAENSGNLFNVRAGCYELHLRSTDSAGSKGRYALRVFAFKAGQIRGAASGGYYVKDDGWAGLDSARLEVGAILDTLQAGFGSQTNQANLDVPVSTRASGGGMGAYPCSLFVFNTADSSALQGVAVRFMNATQTATEAVALTNSVGLAVASLDAAEYKVWMYQAGLGFGSQPMTVAVTAPGMRDSVWGTTFDPGEPVEPELCRVYGWVFDLSGIGIDGVTVTAGMSETPLRYQASVISPFSRTTATDSTGYWFLDVYPSETLSPSDTKYEFTIYYEPGRIMRKKAAVPNQASWELSW